MALLDCRGAIIIANPAFSQLTGRDDTALIGMPLTALVIPAHRLLVRGATGKLSEGRPVGEPPIVRLYPDAADRWAELHLAVLPLADDQFAGRGFVAQLVDVTEHRLQERRLRDMAYRDPVTQVLSRRGIEHAITTFCQRSERGERPGALLAIDLDRFKAVNDTLGHPVGDVVLSRVAADMRRRLRARDLIGRLGGDEFVVLLPSCDAADAQAVAHDLLAAVGGGLDTNGQAEHPGPGQSADEVAVTASIGIALFEPHVPPEDVVGAADRALYEAKRRGGNCWAMAPGGAGEAQDDGPWTPSSTVYLGQLVGGSAPASGIR
jgi:diguanylate cyclase (GGDEF)-like protein/PAS domain S-box-containing protein